VLNRPSRTPPLGMRYRVARQLGLCSADNGGQLAVRVSQYIQLQPQLQTWTENQFWLLTLAFTLSLTETGVNQYNHQNCPFFHLLSQQNFCSVAEGNSRSCYTAGNIRCNAPSVFAGCELDLGWWWMDLFAFRELLHVMGGKLGRVVGFHFVHHSAMCGARSCLAIFGR
jgi:hypothetical protein